MSSAAFPRFTCIFCSNCDTLSTSGKMLHAGWRAFKLAFEILLAESYVLYMSIKRMEHLSTKMGGQTEGKAKIWGP